MKGRVRLRDGFSGELFPVAKILSYRAQANLVPLVIGPTNVELVDLNNFGSYVCCCPAAEEGSNLVDPDSFLFWDISLCWAERKVVQRPLIVVISSENSLFVKALDSAISDEAFVQACKQIFDETELL